MKNDEKQSEQERLDYKRKMKHSRRMLFIELFFTLAITVTVTVNVWQGLYSDAGQRAKEVAADYQTTIESYVHAFETMVIPIEDKIKENLSFDDMEKWLQSKERYYKKAMGDKVYDGIAFTYKGGYVHSWDYGDYSNYDPTTRPWYQRAQAADGEITVVSPYVTYLDPSYVGNDGYILMTIAKKYNDEICFDLDMKITEIKAILADAQLQYDNEKIVLYDKDGYILSTNENKEFAHNIYTPDHIITEDYSKKIMENEQHKNSLLISSINGTWQYLYFSQDAGGNNVCVIIPFMEVFLHNFLLPFLIALILVFLEVGLYLQNKRNTIEFIERDRRLAVVSDTIYSERLYVNISTMEFYGNDMAGRLCKNGTYDELYALIQSRIVNKEDFPRVEAFLSPSTLKKSMDRQYCIDSERFLMQMMGEKGALKEQTIEISRMTYTQDKVPMASVSMRDASESADLLKEALDAANRASESKGNFLSNMSHEIRTPLNAIIGYLGIARDADCTPVKKDYCIENCEVASKHLLQIINDILDMSSIETGKLKIAHEEFDLKKEIVDITTIFFQNAKTKNVEFETHVEELTQERVIGDQLRLNQVLMNLLSNAVKFTPEHGRIQLKVHQIREDDTKVYIQFVVKDTGIGMSEEYMSRIFKPFEQENAGTARRFGGSGLGLSITNNLIHLMGGKIKVESKPDQGTTFIVTMYFGKAKEHKTVMNSADYSRVRVLLVDDKEEESNYVKMMLKRCGVKSDTVTSGRKALRQIRKRMGSDYAYDLCIIDWKMPDMDGGEVTRQIRKEFGEKLPIIIATAYDINQFTEEALEAGANKIIAKPLFQSTIFDLLVSTFGGYDPEAGKSEKKVHIDMRGVHILLAEDNAMNMDIAVTMLEKTGMTVDQAQDGKEAYDLFVSSEPGTYDMILMDVQMPVMDGYAATKAIRSSGHKESKTIPIIAMTANAFAEDVAEALSKGMNAHISKPINYDKMFELLNKYIKKKG